jgi:ABC-2 type transport system permease protein
VAQLINLLLNENMKIYRRWRTWIFMIVLVGLFTFTYVMEFQQKNNRPEVEAEVTSSDWRTQAQTQLTLDKEQLGYVLNDKDNVESNKDYKKWLEDSIAINEYRLAENVPPLNNTMWQSSSIALAFLPLVLIFSVIVAADTVSSEFATGTIKLLLVQPVSRSKILLSKYITVLVFFVILLFLLILSSILSSGLIHQFAGFSIPDVSVNRLGDIQTTNMLHKIAETFGYQSIEIFFVITIAFMISTIFRTSAIAIAISIALTFIGPSVMFIISRFNWSKYYLFRHTKLSPDDVIGLQASGISLSFSITVLVIYYLIFIALTWIIFNRRDVTA